MEEYILAKKTSQLSLIAVVILSVFMFNIDYSMLNISLPTVAKYFNINIARASILPIIYMLIVTSLLLGFGKLGDIRGYKKIFIAGVVIFALGAIVACVSPTLKILILARIIQSVGEAMFSPIGIAILTTFLPSSMRGTALGLVALAQGFGFAAGSPMGGFVTTYLGWRAIFLLDIPIAILILLLAFKFIPSKQPETSERRFDIVGNVLIFIALSTMLYALTSLQEVTKRHPGIPIFLVISCLAFILFIIQEKKVTYPLLDLHLFKNRSFTFANIASFCAIFLMMGFIFLAPFYFELVRGLNATQIGILLIIPSLTMTLVAPISGMASDIIGSRTICTVGAVLEAMAFVMLFYIRASSGALPVYIALFSLGLAAGLFLPPNNRLVMLQTPRDKQGVGSGIYKISLATGSIFGIAIMPIIILRKAVTMAGKMHVTLAQLKDQPIILETSFRNAFFCGIFIALLAALFAFLAKDPQ